MNKEDLIKKAMSELGKKSAKKRGRDPQFYRDLVNKRWAKRKQELEK